MSYTGNGSVSLAYSTYLGGYGKDNGVDIAIGAAGSAYVTGTTESTDFPTVKQYQKNQTDIDVFVSKLAYSGSGNVSLIYSTYLGGDRNDFVYGIALDGSGNAYVTGYTYSTTFPLVNRYQTDQLNEDAFVTKLTYSGLGNVTLGYSTYLGGKGTDVRLGIAVDADSTAYVCESTTSTDFPTLNPYQTSQGGTDGFVTKLTQKSDGIVSLAYSTYLGGSNADYVRGIAIHDKENAYLMGVTSSTDFPTVNPDQSHNALDDIFVTQLLFGPGLDVPAEPANRGAATDSHLLVPNPASNILHCSFTLRRTTDVVMQIYTTDGREVSAPVLTESLDAGTYSRSIPVARLPPGIYTLRVMAGVDSFTRQFAVVR